MSKKPSIFDVLAMFRYNERMHFDVFTLFPDSLLPYLNESILKRAQQANLLHVELHNIRDWAADKHRTTDDDPYGGGGGMVLKVEPLDRCLQALGYSHRTHESTADPAGRILLTSAAGKLSG